MSVPTLAGSYINGVYRLITTVKGIQEEGKTAHKKGFAMTEQVAADRGKFEARYLASGNHQPTPAEAAPILCPHDRLDHGWRRSGAGCAFFALIAALTLMTTADPWGRGCS